MNHKLRKGLALAVLLACMAFPALAEVAFNEAGTFPICKETVALTVAIPDNVRIEDYETNLQTRKIEEFGNYDLTFAVYPSTDYVTKLNLMAMAGGSELPDVLLFGGGSVNDSMIYQWAQAAVLVPLTQYYNDPSISYYLHQAVERTGSDFFSMISSPDGEIYGVPSLNQSWGNEYRDKLYYYEPWLTQLGMEAPATTEAFRSVLRAVQAGDMNGNGKADEIGLTGTSLSGPYSGWFRFLMNAFVYAGDYDYFTVTDGAVGAAYATDAWKEGLLYIRGLVEEGLIADETLTQDKAQLTALANAKEQAIFSMVGAMPAEIIDFTNDARNQFVGLAPLTGPEGVRYATFNRSVANIAFVVTANCKEPEAAFRMGDLMVCEYLSLMSRWGEEGVQWDYPKNVANLEDYVPNVDGAEVMYAVYDDDNFWGGSAVMNASYRQTGPYIREYKLSMGIGKSGLARSGYSIHQSAAQSLYQLGGYAPAETIPKLIYDTDESERISEIASTLKSYVNEMTANFLAGNLDIAAQWDAYLNELQNIGLQTVLETVQPVYERMYD